MQRSRWSEFVTTQRLCCQLCYVTAANQRAIVEIELLATVSWSCVCQPFSCSWKRGGQPFSCRCSQKLMHCRKEMCCTCLFQKFIPASLSWNSRPTLPTRSLRLLRAAAGYTSSALWFSSCPSLRSSCRKKQFHAEKQSVWPRSCRIRAE